MGADGEELLNVYDAAGEIVGARPRTEAKASGLAVGAINLIVRDGAGRVLLQRRPEGTENGGRWDKSVGGHVGAGEDFDTTALREAGEELFDDPSSRRVLLARSRGQYDHEVASADLSTSVVIRRLGMKLNLRDVRIADGGGLRVIVYHVAMYEGRTAIPLEGFRPQASEIESLAYFSVAEVDRMLVEGGLAPNMAFLWLEYGHRLLGGRATAG
jgi:isopentenyldiphosphate isomerase